MSEIQAKLLDEQTELYDKIQKLADFLSKDKPEYMSEMQWNLIQTQADIMVSYAKILGMRILDLYEND